MSTNRERAELILFDLMNRDEEVSNAMFGDEYVSYVSALADARLLRPDLPEPDSGGEWADTRGAWVVSPLQGGTCVRVDDDLTPDETRDLADALYAAADHAEKEGTDEQDN